MGIPLVALQSNSAQLAKVESPIEAQKRVLSLRQVLDEQKQRQQTLQSNDINLQQQQQAQKDSQVIGDLYKSVGGDADKFMEALPASGASPAAVMKTQEAITKHKADLLALPKAEFDLQLQKNKIVGNALDSVLATPTEARPAAWQNSIKQLTQQGAMSPEEAQQYAEYPGDDKVQMLDMARKTTEQLQAQAATARAAKQQDITNEHNKVMEVPATERQFQATYKNWLGANGKTANAKNEMDYRKIYSNEQAAQRRAGTAAGGEVVPEAPGPTDPESGSILKQTGLTMPAFMALTGASSQLPRDKETRNKAFKEAEAWANKRGMDTSTMASQYKSYNDVLGKNIARLNNTKIMESELQGTIGNLQSVVKQKDLGDLNFANVAKIWAGQQVNDDLAQQYAVHLSQLRNELAAYYAASQGRAGGEINLSDQRDAENVIKSGISSGSLSGLEKAVKNSTDKMGTVMRGSVDNSRKAIWDLFGVGGNYKPTAEAKPAGNRKSLEDIFAQ